MKRNLLIVFAGMLLLLLVGCNNTTKESTTITKEQTTTTEIVTSATSTFTETEDSSTTIAVTTSTKEENTTTTEEKITTVETTTKDPNSIKILGIGNSFTDDGMWLLYQVLESVGYTDITLGILYIGGCSLEKHWINAQTNAASYTYRKNTTGSYTSTNNVSILTGMNDEDWDFVTLQQASGVSGMIDTYNSDLINMVKYINKIKSENCKLLWQMTWAYQQDSTHSEFVNYNNDQLTMYNAICNATKEKIVTNSNFFAVIPSGTAIQNYRTSLVGDKLTRDGYHLNSAYGRYTAALTWMIMLTGKSAYDCTYIPSGVTAQQALIAKESATNACLNMFEITNSKYTS